MSHGIPYPISFRPLLVGPKSLSIRYLPYSISQGNRLFGRKYLIHIKLFLLNLKYLIYSGMRILFVIPYASIVTEC